MQPAATQPRRGTILALALLAACAYAAFAHGAARIPDETWLQVGLDVAALLTVAGWLSRREALQTTREGWLGIALLTGFGVWCAITMLWSVTPDESWLEANRSLAYALVVVLAVGLGTVSGPAIERISTGWLVVASAVAVYALARKVAPGLIAPDEPIARLRAPLQYWNALALVCAMAVPVALRVITDTARDPWPRLAALAAASALLLTMGLTYSRGGFVALAIGIGIVTWLGRRRLRGLGAFALAALAAGPALAVAFTLDGLTNDNATLGARIHDGRIFGAVGLIMLGLLLAAGNWALRFERHRRLDRATETWIWQGLAAVAGVVVLVAIAAVAAAPSRVWHDFADVKQDRRYDPARLVSTNSGNRWVWWKEAAGAFSDKPAGGWGAGSFGTVHLRYREQPLGVKQPHNVELQWLAETGIVGFLLALGGLAALFVAAATRLRRLPEGTERELAIALLAAAAGWVVHGLVDWDWDIPAVTLPPLIFLGVLAARPGPRPAAAPFGDPEPSGAAVRAFAVVGAALLLCGLIASAVLPEISQSRTEAAETASSPDTAARDADVAARLNPVAVRPLIVASSIEVRRGRLVEARKRLLEAAGRQPENPEVWFRLAQLSQQLADTSGYQTAIKRFAQLDPKNPVTGALLTQALAIEAPANASATATGTPLPGAPLTAPAPPAAP